MIADAKRSQLLQERERLRRSLEGANANVQSKSGEISILRSNHATHTKGLERKLVAIQKLHADEMTRRNEELKRIAKERENVVTENNSLKQDLTEVVQEARQSKRNVKDGELLAAATANKRITANSITTPKKGLTGRYRDGFDKDEIMVISPSKSGGKSRAGTPKVGGKRKKRAFQESPGQVLPLSQSPRVVLPDIESQRNESADGTMLLQKFSKKDGRYDVCCRPFEVISQRLTVISSFR